MDVVPTNQPAVALPNLEPQIEVGVDGAEQPILVEARAGAVHVAALRAYNARLDFRARYWTGSTAADDDVTTTLGQRASWAGSTGLTQANPARTLSATTTRSRAATGRALPPSRFAGPSAASGARPTPLAAATTAAVSASRSTAAGSTWRATVSVSTRLVDCPGPCTVDQEARGELQLTADPARSSLEGNWIMMSHTLGASTALSLFEGPWSLDIDAPANTPTRVRRQRRPSTWAHRSQGV